MQQAQTKKKTFPQKETITSIQYASVKINKRKLNRLHILRLNLVCKSTLTNNAIIYSESKGIWINSFITRINLRGALYATHWKETVFLLNLPCITRGFQFLSGPLVYEVPEILSAERDQLHAIGFLLLGQFSFDRSRSRGHSWHCLQQRRIYLQRQSHKKHANEVAPL